MNRLELRQEIADALSAVEGIKGFPYEPSNFKTGHAWVDIASEEAVDGVWIYSWIVTVHAPQTSAEAAARWVDENTDAIRDGLSEVAFIDDVVRAVTENKEYVLIVNMRS